MKAWNRIASRYAALPKRERALLPGALCFGIAVLGVMLFIQPAQKQQSQLQRQIAQERGDLRLLQDQITVLNAKRQDPNAAIRAQLVSLRTQAGAVDDEFKQLQRSLVPAQQMSQWLSGVLQAQRGLQLTGLRSLPVASVSELTAKPTAAAAAAATTPASAAAGKEEPSPSWLYRHGVEITLSGNYNDLYSYVNALEQLPKRVYWGELKIDAQAHPKVVMTLTVYTISLEKTWWVI